MTEPDPELEAVRTEMAEQKARQARLIEQHGNAESISDGDALALARAAGAGISPDVTAYDVHASIYRDDTAAGAWLESNRVHHGHPTLARVLLDDGRVLGILDLRPELAKARERCLGDTDGSAGNKAMKNASTSYLEGYERGRQRRQRESANGEQS